MSLPLIYFNNTAMLPAKGVLPAGFRFPCEANQSIVAGQLVVCELNANAVDVQTVTITGGPTGGTFQLVANGQVTPALSYAATAAQVQAALTGLSSIGAGGVVCTGGPLPGTPIVVTFAGNLANYYQNLITTANVNFTGGATPAIAVAHTTTGHRYGGVRAYVQGEGTVTPLVSRNTWTSDSLGRAVLGTTTTPNMGYDYDVAAFVGGIFRYGDITNIDANAIALRAAKFLWGSAADPNSPLFIPGGQI